MRLSAAVHDWSKVVRYNNPNEHENLPIVEHRNCLEITSAAAKR